MQEGHGRLGNSLLPRKKKLSLRVTPLKHNMLLGNRRQSGSDLPLRGSLTFLGLSFLICPTVMITLISQGGYEGDMK